MANESFLLPMMSPSQAGNSPSAKTPNVLQVSYASCSTVASEFSSQLGDCTDSEFDSLSSPREVSSNDVEWLLSSMTANQKSYLDRNAFHRECLRIFKNNDMDDNGFLDTQELRQVLEQLIPDSHRSLENAAGHRLVLSIKTVIATFDKDSDRQLSAEEFCDFVRFCYAWRCHYETMTASTKGYSTRDLQAGEECEKVGLGTTQDISPMQSPPTPGGSGYRILKSLSLGTLGLTDNSKSLPASPPPDSDAQIHTPSSNSSKPRSSSLARLHLEPLPSADSSYQKLSSLISNRGNSRALSRKVSPEPQASFRRVSPGPQASFRTKSSPCSRKVSPRPLAARSRRPQSSSSLRRVAKAQNLSSPSLSASASEPQLLSARSSKSAGLLGRVPEQHMSVGPSPLSSGRLAIETSPRSSGSLAVESASSATSGLNSTASSRPPKHEGLPRRQLQALRVLVRELAPAHTSLHDLVSTLLQKVMSPDGSATFPLETQQHICDVVTQAVVIPSSPEDVGRTLSSSHSLRAFLEFMHHSAAPLPANKKLKDLMEESWFLEDRVIEVIAMLSVRWHAMQYEESIPEMTEYAQRRWLPPAFSSLAGQVLWRHRTAASLKKFEADVESVRWVTSLLDERVVEDFNRVFKHFAGSNGGVMKLSLFRRIVDLLALNPDLRPRLRRCDAVRSCYGDIAGRGAQGMNKKDFKLMLLKTAELMVVHPATLFKELASRADALEPPRNASR